MRTASWKTASALVAAESEDSGRSVEGGGVMRMVGGKSKPDSADTLDEIVGESFWV